jgi:hypothetical protein
MYKLFYHLLSLSTTQFDKKWESDRGFVFYDFNDSENVPAELKGTFDLLVIDPPFITHEVWTKYAETSRVLCKTAPVAHGNGE